MPEKEPQVTFTDRRKISSDGEIRPEAVAEEEAARREAERREAASKAATPAAPTSEATATAPPVTTVDAGESASNPDAQEALPDGPTAQETAESHAAYNHAEGIHGWFFRIAYGGHAGGV